MRTAGEVLGAAAVVLLCAVAFAAAQHETAADIEDGARAFRSTCANCHGPDGNEVPGIDLGRGVFRRPMTDQDLIDTIRNGIPGTSMPASSLSAEQAARIVAYLRATAAAGRSALSGDAQRGRDLVEGKGGCLSCHRVNGKGSRLGPDLSGIGRLRRAAELEQSLVDPDAEILAPNRMYRVVTRDGTTVSGRLLNLDTFTVQMLDTSEQLRSFEKSALREHGFVDRSPMPSYRDRLSAQELADVVAYLASLKGTMTP